MFQIAEALRQLEIPLPQAASGVSQKIVGGAPFRAQLGRFSTLRTSGQNSNKVVGATIVNGEVVDALPANPPSPVSNSADDVFVDPYEDVVAVGSVEAWSCSGVVVSPRHILTAAHCLPATRIAVGYRTDAPKMAVQVSRTSRHKRADAAILELAEEIPVSPRSRRRASHSRAPYGDAVLVGFGAEDHAGERGHGVMRKASTPLAGWGCDGARPDTIRCNPEFEMVIPGSGKTDTCNGDSGGPVFENVAGESRLLAITSRPIPTTAAPCGRGGIYVRVDKISDWILQQMDPPTLSTP